MKCWELYGPLDNSFFGPRVWAEYRGARHAARRWAGAGAECSGGAAAGGAALHSLAHIIYIYIQTIYIYMYIYIYVYVYIYIL